MSDFIRHKQRKSWQRILCTSPSLPSPHTACIIIIISFVCLACLVWLVWLANEVVCGSLRASTVAIVINVAAKNENVHQFNRKCSTASASESGINRDPPWCVSSAAKSIGETLKMRWGRNESLRKHWVNKLGKVNKGRSKRSIYQCEGVFHNSWGNPRCDLCSLNAECISLFHLIYLSWIPFCCRSVPTGRIHLCQLSEQTKSGRE